MPPEQLPRQLIKQIATLQNDVAQIKRREAVANLDSIKDEILALQDARIAELEADLSDLTQTVIQFITIVEASGVIDLPDGFLTDSTGV